MVLFIAFTVRFMQPGLLALKQAKTKPSLAQFYETLFRWRWLPYSVMAVFILEPLLSPGTVGLSARYYPPIYIVCSLYIPVLSLSIALAGFRPAWVFLTAWSILIGSNILGTLDLMGAIELNGWAKVIAILGASLEMMILSIALGLSVRASQKAKDQAQLERQNAEFMMAQKERFFSTLSHEIRTPLHAILGANSLLGKTQLSDKQKNYWDSTHYAAESMVAIVDNLLDRAELHEGHSLEQDSVFDAERLLQAMVQLLKPRAEEKNVELLLETESLPDKLLGKPLVVRRLLINLIGNAIKYTERGQIKVQVKWLSELECLNIAVQDTGCGIAEDQLQGLTERFNRSLESHYSQDASSGLGLAICYEMINSCGGQLTIDSELGKGTIVTAKMNMQASAKEHSSEHSNETKVINDFSDQHLDEYHVLVVDDVASNRMIAQEIIEGLGCQVITADDAYQALAFLETQTIDLVFSDLRMPEMSGEALYLTIKETAMKEYPKFILTSAHFNQKQIEQLEEQGIDLCLPKPYSPEQLEQAIVQLLGKSLINDSNSLPIKARLGESKYQQLIALFMQQLEQDIGRINQALEDNQWRELNIAAHRIVSASRALSIDDIALIASQLEEMTMTDDQVDAEQISNKLSSLIQTKDAFSQTNNV